MESFKTTTADKCTVFIVEDDASVHVALARLLRASGFPCRSFQSAETFLEDVAPTAAGCAIVDVHMPGMNGMELANLLRQTYTKIFPILMTAFEDPAMERQASHAGLTLLRKPFDATTLLAAITAATS
jgi:FixJ family two-component response regulator